MRKNHPNLLTIKAAGIAAIPVKLSQALIKS
jgi:hypothetical protein